MVALDARRTAILAILVLFLGKYLNQKIQIFHEFNIPEPVTGGVLASLIFGAFFVAIANAIIINDVLGWLG